MSTQEKDAAPLLNALSRGLRELHQALVEFARRDYEIIYGPIEGPGHLLQLLTREPQFSWLHVMSELMIDIDRLRDEEPLTSAEMRAVRRQVEALVSSSGNEQQEFNERYMGALQRSTATVMAHANVRRILSNFP